MKKNNEFKIEALETRLEMATWIATKCALGDSDACAEQEANQL